MTQWLMAAVTQQDVRQFLIEGWEPFAVTMQPQTNGEMLPVVWMKVVKGHAEKWGMLWGMQDTLPGFWVAEGSADTMGGKV